MTENNTFFKIIGNYEPISIIECNKDTLKCNVNYKDENNITTEYTLFLNKDKISIFNNSKILIGDQDYSFNILEIIISDIIDNTYSYEENVPRYKRSEKAQIKNLIARIIFENIDDINYIDNFQFLMGEKKFFINEMNYSVLFKICCEAEKLEFFKYLFLNISDYNINAQSFKNNEEIAAEKKQKEKEIIKLLATILLMLPLILIPKHHNKHHILVKNKSYLSKFRLI